MEEPQKNIDDLFRESLAGYREAPPDTVWPRIARRLDEEERRRRGLWMRWPWVALLLVVMLGAGWWALQGPRTDSHSAARTPAAATTEQGSGLGAYSKATVSVADAADRLPTKHAMAVAVAYHPTRNSTPASASDIQKENRMADAAQPDAPSVPQPAELPMPRSQTNAPALRASAPRQMATAPAQGPASLLSSAAIPVAPIVRPSIHDLPALEKAGNATAATSFSASASSDALKAMPVRSPGTHSPPLAASQNKPFGIPASSQHPAPLAADIPGFSAQLPYDERWSESGLAPLDLVQAAPPPSVAPPQVQAAQLPSASTIAGTSSAGLPQPINDPLPLRKSSYPKSISLAVVAGGAYASSLNGYYDAGLRAMLQISSRIAIGLQPAIGLGTLAHVRLSDAQAYYRSQITVDSFLTADPSPSVRHAIDTIHNYVVQEQLDSIVMAGLAASGQFWEISLPVLIRCSLNDRWYAYGGPSLHLGGKLSATPEAAPSVYSKIRRDSLAQSQALPANAFEHYFGRPGMPPVSSYADPNLATGPSVRLGYTVGIGYGHGRVFGEASLSQQFCGSGSYEQALQSVFSQPRISLQVGYLLFDSRKKSITPLQ